jgi:hypothetical protein
MHGNENSTRHKSHSTGKVEKTVYKDTEMTNQAPLLMFIK